MDFSRVASRARGKIHRLATTHFGKRPAPVELETPIVSFTFDDAPKTAFYAGRDVLKACGARATYYVSLGLLDSDTEVGRIASRGDLGSALADGCELGCHTYDHLDARHAPLNAFAESIARNADRLREILPGARYSSFAYPKSGASLAAKTLVSNRFSCCRGGRETINEGVADLNLLNAIFLDRRTGADECFVGRWIEQNAAKRGWLIFATHDVAANPSPYGCTPGLLEYAARRSRDCGARILPVAEACALLRAR